MFNKRNKLNKRLINASSDDVVRNHAYSRVAKENPTLPSRASLRPRAHSSYRDSMVGSTSQYRDRLPPKLTPDTKTPIASNDGVVGNRPSSSSVKNSSADNTARRKHHFVEPPKRGFNRFG